MVYMDDRTIISADPRRVLDGVCDWESWSETVGLEENSVKTQLVGKNEAGAEELRREIPAKELAGWEEKVVRMADVLGVTLKQTEAKAEMSEKEKGRIAKFRDAIATLRIVPCGRRMKQTLMRSLALSSLVYGWVTRTPNIVDMDRWATALFRAAGGLNGANT